MNHQNVEVRCALPTAALASFVTFFYHVEVDGPLEDFLYPEWGNVRFALAGEWFVEIPGTPLHTPQDAVLFGPTDRHSAVRTPGGACVGFGLTPLGWHRLLGGDASRLANRVVPIDQRLGCDPNILRHALITDGDDKARIARLETLLLKLLERSKPISAQVLSVDRALRNRHTTVAEFSADAGMSWRSLHRLCLSTFGFAPKRLMRLQRFLDTLGLVRQAVGGKVSANVGEGYFDQAHFYLDFRDFMAMTPRQYFTAPRPLMGVAAEAQVRAGVTLSFRLPDPAD